MQNNSECYWYVSIKCTWSIKKDTKWNNKTWQVGAQYNQLRLFLKPPLTLATQKWWTVKWSGRQGATSPSTAWINPSSLPLMTTATSCCCMSPSPSSCQFIRTIYLVISVVPFSHSISGSSESWSILLNWDSWESKCVVVNSKKQHHLFGKSGNHTMKHLVNRKYMYNFPGGSASSVPTPSDSCCCFFARTLALPSCHPSHPLLCFCWCKQFSASAATPVLCWLPSSSPPRLNPHKNNLHWHHQLPWWMYNFPGFPVPFSVLWVRPWQLFLDSEHTVMP